MGGTTNEIPTEFIKAISDHCKHITTLSSGFILVMVTFLENLFSQPDWKCLVVISFVSFAISIFLSVYSQALVIDYLYPVSAIDTTKKAQITSIVLISTWTTFTIGSISLIVFAIKNFIS